MSGSGGERTLAYHAAFFTFDASELLAGTVELRVRVKLTWSGDTYNGVGRVVFTDLSGNELRFCATTTGERIKL